jgi:PAS domain S-box-containing protein
MKILFVEDMPLDAELAERLLRKDGMAFESLRVDTREAFLAALSEFLPDVIVSDYSMPSFDGMSALLLAREHDALIPFVVLTGSMNEDTAVSCMKAGASDYVIKEHMSRLPFAVKEAMELSHTLRLAKEQEKVLRQNEERYRTLFNGSSAVMLIVDPDGGGIADANKTALAFYGLPRSALLEMSIDQLSTLSREQMRERLHRALNQELRVSESRHKKSDGREVDVELHTGPIRIKDKTFLLIIIHDISERKKAELDRDRAAARLSQFIVASPTITYSLRLVKGATNLEWISENVQRILGYTMEEALSPEWWFKNVHPQDRSQALAGLSELAKKGSSSQEYRFMRKDKSEVWLLEELRCVDYEGGEEGIVGSLTDVSERKIAEEELRLKGAALEAAENAVVITDRIGAIEWANGAFERLTSYAKDEAIGRTLGQLVKSGKHDQAFYRSLWETISSGETWTGEIWNQKKNGELYLEEMTITPVQNQSRRIEHFIAIKRDITERYRTQERLEASLREKEALLREIHHRVNNNLQIISSLLSLSAARSSDAMYQAASDAMIRRIATMALAHEQLYGSSDVAKISFSLYLREIVDILLSADESIQTRPNLEFSLDELYLSIEAAIPAGIAVSELVSNALRHGVRGMGDAGRILIGMHALPGGELQIQVQDNGPGFPEGLDPSLAETLGLRLVDILSTQLQGTIEYRQQGGTTATLRFYPGGKPEG